MHHVHEKMKKKTASINLLKNNYSLYYNYATSLSIVLNASRSEFYKIMLLCYASVLLIF